MNAQDVLRQGHLAVLRAIDDLPEEHWYRPGVSGIWSVRDILAHLASHERAFVEISQLLIDGGSTSHLEKFKEGVMRFNDPEVAKRHEMTAAEVLAEYNQAHSQTIPLIAQIPEETRRQPGTLPWYGEQYSLEDFIVYRVYGHKREHTAHINVYRDELDRAEMVAEGGYATG